MKRPKLEKTKPNASVLADGVSPAKPDWASFFALAVDVPADFLAVRIDLPPQSRRPL
jgi:hypothetical protein